MAFLLIGLSEHRPQPLGQGSPLRWLALLFGLPAWHAGAGERVIYPRHSEGRNPEPYVVELLQLALARSGGDYRLEPSAQPMPQSRAQLRLEQDDPGLQVMWAQSRDDLEETLLPIRIPIYRGLIGWRIPLVSAANKDLLASVRTLDDLRRLRFGQRQDWADTPILRANGLEVKTSQNYESLFRMLDAGRFEVFPREVVVIDGELEDASRAGLHLAIDQHLALHYPAAFYFFVSRQRPELAEAIRQGLEKAIADGSFERLFERHFKTRLGKLALRQRRIIELKNPYLPGKTPFQREALWYRP
ncbi:transporter substrate-binding domain-containing protein [Pseudomonas aeruginosa]|uniref:substrate-binding periplasmic protein n=1 Tax=Pseudomonas aeruginosa TaxID=287 RepID=UPI000FC41047|nr:transporter substrate-binding domain-containing protein [Pseudomonas aeruginosa]RUG95895.1 transporter substrate-binding domain-containing protein [Pseudomonas aeruginosa]